MLGTGCLLAHPINIIVNPSFETDVVYTNSLDKLPDNWTYITNYPSTYQWSDSIALFGSRSLRVATPGNKGGVVQSAVSVKASTSYAFRCSFASPNFSRFNNPGCGYVVETNEFNTSGTRIKANSYFLRPTNDGWFTIGKSFITMPTTAKVSITFFSLPKAQTPPESTYTFIDGVQLIEGTDTTQFYSTYDGLPSPAPVNENLVRNCGFESIHNAISRPTDWGIITNYSSTYSISTTQVVGGNRSIACVENQGVAGVISDIIKATPNTAYSLTLHAKMTYNNGYVEIKCNRYNNKMSLLSSPYSNVVLKAGWQRCAYNFTTDAQTEYVQIVISQRTTADNLPDTVWFDNVQLQRGAYPSDFQLPTPVPAVGTLCGRFARYQLGQDTDMPLKKLNGETLNQSDVTTLYGSPDGYTVLDDGMDVCSKAYATLHNLPQPLQPKFQDLSSSWPNPTVTPGVLAVDPALGRFALFSGDSRTASFNTLQSFSWTGFGVPGIGDIKVQGNYAYVPSGEGDFQILDISDRSAPHIEGHLSADFNNFVEVSGNVAFLCSQGSLYLIDITNPAEPKFFNGTRSASKVWTPSLGGGVSEIKISGAIAYATVSGSRNAFYILDISNPANIDELSHVDCNDTLGAGELFINGSYAYVGYGKVVSGYDAFGNGAAIIAIGNPFQPTFQASYKGEPGATKYEIPYLIGNSGSNLIMATKARSSSPARFGEFIIVDASNPATPVRRGTLTFAGTYQLTLKRAVSNGQMAYVTDCVYDYTASSLNKNSTPSRLLSINITDPDAPAITAIDTQKVSRFMNVTLNGTDLFINDYNYGTRIFSIADSAHPVALGKTPTAGEGHVCYVNETGTRAYLSQTFGGTIHAFDISNPYAPLRLGHYWDGEWSEEYLSGKDDILYMSHSNYLSCVNMSDPAGFCKVMDFSSVTPAAYPRTFVYGKLLFVSFKKTGTTKKVLQMYDISNPSEPVLRSELTLIAATTTNTSPQIFVNNNYAYVMCGDENSLFVINYSNPLCPFIEGQLTDAAHLNIGNVSKRGKLLVTNTTAYIWTGTTDSRVFHIVDVTNPNVPVFVKTFENALLQGEGYQYYQVLRNTLITGNYADMITFDISNPQSPLFLGSAKQGGVLTAGTWTMGQYRSNGMLYYPSLNGLNILSIARESDALTGTVTTQSNL